MTSAIALSHDTKRLRDRGPAACQSRRSAIAVMTPLEQRVAVTESSAMKAK